MSSRAVFSELPLTCISPEGWLRRYLELQRDGLTGHLEAAGYPFNTKGWAAKVDMQRGETWWPYEQTGYWVDGMIRCGYLLGDRLLIDKAMKQIDHVLARPDREGYLGPAHMKKPGNWNRWAHAVFFRSLMAHHSATGDERVPKALSRHYLSKSSPHSGGRDVANVEQMCWLHERAGDSRLIEMALAAYDGFCKGESCKEVWLQTLLSDERPSGHGVSYMELSKLPAILYMRDGRKRFLDASVRAFEKLDRHCMMVDGVPSSSEYLAGKTDTDLHETCDIADYTWSAGYLLMATGDARYADRIERAVMNAAPGAVRSDFKGLQYFSGPNQFLATSCSDHSAYKCGSSWMSYRPNPGTECCPGEVNRIMPNYIARMWLGDGRGGVVAAMFGPSRLRTKVGRTSDNVTIVQETDYPFGDCVEFSFRVDKPARFPFWLRIPGWCRRPGVYVNGKPVRVNAKPGGFVRLDRVFSNNDRVTLELPAETAVTRWPRGGVAVERGPLVYSLGVAEDWRIDRRDKRCSRDMPAWDLHAAAPWNFALALDSKSIGQVEIERRAMTSEPWSQTSAPIAIKVPVKRVSGWKLIRKKKVLRGMPGKEEEACGDFTLTPPIPMPGELRGRLGKIEMATLVPYGCAKARLTIFPQAK